MKILWKKNRQGERDRVRVKFKTPKDINIEIPEAASRKTLCVTLPK